MSDFLEKLHDEGLMKDKLVIFGGDHGNRFTWSRTSLGGRFEERMPFMAVSLPKSIRDSEPQWQENMENNKEKLISNFDLHLTIKQFLSNKYKNKYNKSKEKVTHQQSEREPLSILEAIPSNRTCGEAGVPEYYCVCIPESYIPLRSPLVHLAGNTLIKKINHLVSPFRNICEVQQLSKILEARRLQSETQHVRLVLETNTGATYEGLLSSDGGEIIGDINRLDFGGDTVKCMDRDYRQLFCHCRPEEVLDQDLFEDDAKDKYN